MKNIIQVILLLILVFIFSTRVSEANVYSPTTSQVQLKGSKKPVPYDRNLWKHWIDEDHDCLNTRQEILLSRVQSKFKVEFSKNGCLVLKGKWNDFYAKEILIKAVNIDIDHVVPLKHAHDVGGWKWSSQAKQNFANDPDNLVITNLKYNRSKGAKSIANWLPDGSKYVCRYINLWFKIKKKYSLIFKTDEKNLITKMKLTCI